MRGGQIRVRINPEFGLIGLEKGHPNSIRTYNLIQSNPTIIGLDQIKNPD